MAVTAEVKDLVEVHRYTRGLIGPSTEPEQLVKAGGRIRTTSPPGCWGPMITPHFVGGHEVSWPVAVDGAEVDDAIAITIERVDVRSLATSSGTMITKEAAFGSDPFVDRKCPGCGTPWPQTRVEGTGEGAIRCIKCGAECSPFGFEEGYTIVFDDDRVVGITVDAAVAHDFALRAREVAALPEASEQHPILIYEPHTIPGTLARLRSFIGNVGTIPSRDMPDSHNAGDFGSFLIGARHKYAMTEQELAEHRTDGHLDCDAVRPGAVLIVPVKVGGGGIYIGDSHANQGDGELSLHTTDITADVELKVDLLKGVELAGPVLLPVADDLPWIARPFTAEERERGRKLAERYDIRPSGPVGPVQFIGTGPTINEATDNAIERAARLLGISASARRRCEIAAQSAATWKSRDCPARSSSRCSCRWTRWTGSASGRSCASSTAWHSEHRAEGDDQRLAWDLHLGGPGAGRRPPPQPTPGIDRARAPEDPQVPSTRPRRCLSARRPQRHLGERW